MAQIHYFAFGADMLHQKMKLHSFPSELKCNAVLRGWKLVFIGDDERWKGAAASVIEDNISCVWGVVYKISEQFLSKLEAEEPGYKAIKVRVLCASGEVLECRAFQWANGAAPVGKPSPHLRMVIEGGAAENKLPLDYFKKLDTIEENGYRGKVAFDLDLIRSFNG